MFVISSIQEEYCGEIVVTGNDGMSHAKGIHRTNINVPINLQNVLYFNKRTQGPDEDVPSYQISFQFQRFTNCWDYFKKADRDQDYEKLISLNLIGVMCKLENIEI